MPIDFPTPTATGEEFTVGEITWIWDGTTWSSKTTSTVEPNEKKATTFLLMGA